MREALSCTFADRVRSSESTYSHLLLESRVLHLLLLDLVVHVSIRSPILLYVLPKQLCLRDLTLWLGKNAYSKSFVPQHFSWRIAAPFIIENAAIIPGCGTCRFYFQSVQWQTPQPIRGPLQGTPKDEQNAHIDTSLMK